MEISFLTSPDGSIERAIRQQLSCADHMDWAVAYGTTAAFKLLDSEFRGFFARGGASRAVFDLTEGVTDPSLVEELITYPGESKCRVYVGHEAGNGIFHHKLFYFQSGPDASAIVGSANFTKSAFRDNFESCLILSDSTAATGIIQNVRNYFEEKIWNAAGVVNPALDPSILEIYKEFYLLKKKSRSSLNKSLKKLRSSIMELYDSTLDFTTINAGLAYLLGLIAASPNSQKHIDNRHIRLRFRSNVMKPGTINEGYICAPIGGAFLGGINLPQRKTQVTAVYRIFKELENMLKIDDSGNVVTFLDRSAKSTNVYIDLHFSRASQIWAHVAAYLTSSIENGSFVPSVPTDLSSDPDLSKMFLRGYFDFRARISSSDRMANGKLRLAVQIDTNALNFAEEMTQLMYDYGNQIAISDGSYRKRDNMIRFYPTKASLDLFDKGWKRALVNEFIVYNDSNF